METNNDTKINNEAQPVQEQLGQVYSFDVDPYAMPFEGVTEEVIEDFDQEMYEELTEDIEEIDYKALFRKYSSPRRWKSLTLRIRTLYLEGNSFAEIQRQLDLNNKTWDTWYYYNRRGFRDFILSIKDERFIQKAEKFSEELMDLETETEVETEFGVITKTNERLAAIKQKETEFVREALGKNRYSKRHQLTDKDDNPLRTHTVVVVKNYIKPNADTSETGN